MSFGLLLLSSFVIVVIHPVPCRAIPLRPMVSKLDLYIPAAGILPIDVASSQTGNTCPKSKQTMCKYMM